jgi:hypothetical protein
MLLHEEGAEVNKFNLGLLAALDNLYAIIAQYDPKKVFNMDETGLFFRLLPRYSLLMLDEDISTTRGKKKSKDRVSLIVRANAMGIKKIPCALIDKLKAPACIKDRQWPVPYFSQSLDGCGNVLEVVQRNVSSRSEKTNRTSSSFAVGQCPQTL